jgi:hypothetical protein
MKRSSWMSRLALVLALALTALPASHVSVARAETTSDDDISRWWGVAGAVLCGTEIRLVTTAPVIGMNPYVMSAGIAGCLIAVLDIATT